MELIELEKGMILSDCYVVLGVVQKDLNKAKKQYKTMITQQTMPNILIHNVILIVLITII